VAYLSSFVPPSPVWMNFQNPQDKTMKPAVAELTFPLSEEAAKKLVFAHWDFLQHLAQRRFPNDATTAHLALDHVLGALQEKQWQRIRKWEGQGKFATFLGVLAGRLMTDYIRKIYGHQRPPKWLGEKTEPIWMEAYRILIVERFERQEAIGLLETRYPQVPPSTIRKIVSEVIGRCPPRSRYQDSHAVALDDIAEPVSPALTPEAELEPHPRELLEALEGYIRGESPLPEEARSLLEKLQPHLHLSDEDRLFLRLRYCEGLKMTQIAKLLHLKGDPYKRLHKILNAVRSACEKAGIV